MRITGREKIFLWGAGLLAALLLVQLLIYPAFKWSRELTRLVPRKQQELAEVRRLCRELDGLKQARSALLQKIPAPEKALPPLSRLDGWIERSGLRQNVRAIKPSPSSGNEGTGVEIQLEKAELPQLTRFLYEAQSSPGGSQVSRMTIKPRYTAPKYLDVSLQMIFYKG